MRKVIPVLAVLAAVSIVPAAAAKPVALLSIPRGGAVHYPGPRHRLGLNRAARALVIAGRRWSPGAVHTTVQGCSRVSSGWVKCTLVQTGWNPFSNTPDPTGVASFYDINVRARKHWVLVSSPIFQFRYRVAVR